MADTWVGQSVFGSETVNQPITCIWKIRAHIWIFWMQIWIPKLSRISKHMDTMDELNTLSETFLSALWLCFLLLDRLFIVMTVSWQLTIDNRCQVTIDNEPLHLLPLYTKFCISVIFDIEFLYKFALRCPNNLNIHQSVWPEVEKFLMAKSDYF